MKTLYTFVVVVIVLILGFFLVNTYIYNEKQADNDYLPVSHKEAAFTISGESVVLIDGVAEVVTSLGGESKTMVRYFGNEAYGDIDGDGDEDVAFLVTQETGGSGTFFYLVGALKEESGYRGTQAMLIGDRVAPQTTEYKEGLVLINYAERAPGEPMTTPPSMGRSLYAKYSPDTNDFGEVVQDFEGESAY